MTDFEVRVFDRDSHLSGHACIDVSCYLEVVATREHRRHAAHMAGLLARFAVMADPWVRWSGQQHGCNPWVDVDGDGRPKAREPSECSAYCWVDADIDTKYVVEDKGGYLTVRLDVPLEELAEFERRVRRWLAELARPA